jgi:hypothetical protein
MPRETFMVLGKNEIDSIMLMIYERFHGPNCRERSLQIINSFSQLQKKWTTHLYFRESISNFRGCTLYIGSSFGNFYHDIIVKKQADNTNEVVRSTVFLFVEAISSHLNFSFVFKPTYAETVSYNKTIEFDVVFNTDSLERMKYQNLRAVTTVPFLTDSEIILISRNPPFSTFDKIFLPFEIEVWCWLVATLAFFTIAITALLFANQKIQKFVFGRRVNTPLMNLM